MTLETMMKKAIPFLSRKQRYATRKLGNASKLGTFSRRK